jgi:hypothetical protein
MKAVLAGRGDGEGIEDIGHVLDNLGYLKRLVDAKVFAKVRSAIVQEAMDKWQLHWSARHALHVWDKLDLSRSQFENLRHLLSFIFSPQTNRYEPIKVLGRSR